MGGVADGGLHADGDGPVTGPPRRQQHHHVGAIEHGHRGHERAGLDRQPGHHALALPGERVGQHEARRQLVRRRAESPPLRVRIEEDEALFLQDVQEAIRARTGDVAVANDGARRCRPTTSQVPQDDQHPPRSAVRGPVRARARWRRPLVTTWSALHLHAHPLSSRPRVPAEHRRRRSRPGADTMVTSRPSTAAEARSSRARRFGRSRPASLLAGGGKCTHRQIERPVVPCREPTSTVTDEAPAAALRPHRRAEWSRGRGTMRGPTKTERPGCRGSKAATRTLAGDSPRMAPGPLRRDPDHRRGQDGDGVGERRHRGAVVDDRGQRPGLAGGEHHPPRGVGVAEEVDLRVAMLQREEEAIRRDGAAGEDDVVDALDRPSTLAVGRGQPHRARFHFDEAGQRHECHAAVDQACVHRTRRVLADQRREASALVDERDVVSQAGEVVGDGQGRRSVVLGDHDDVRSELDRARQRLGDRHDVGQLASRHVGSAGEAPVATATTSTAAASTSSRVASRPRTTRTPEASKRRAW